MADPYVCDIDGDFNEGDRQRLVGASGLSMWNLPKHPLFLALGFVVLGWIILAKKTMMLVDPQFTVRPEIHVKEAPLSVGSVYQDPVGTDVAVSSLPLPLRVLEQYKEMHSVDALQRNPTQRKFAVVFYSCPLQAGNRLHHFMNGMMWSVLTNRTMLWKYWDNETCLKYGAKYKLAICKSANTVEDCDPILSRAPWIASYDEWADKLSLDEAYELPFYATHPDSVVNIRYPWGPGNDESVRGVDVRYDDEQVVIFAQTRTKITFLLRQSIRESLLHSRRSRMMTKQLYQMGADFLFGALQRYSFDLSERSQEATTSVAKNRSAEYSIALHSRHVDSSLDGCDIELEKKCVIKILKRATKKLCRVALMSDRQCTLVQLSSWLKTQQCSVDVASHETRIDFLSEHGPFAGAGFFQDLALASTARSAFIGLKRSSSDLILELVEFNRRMDLWRDGKDPSLAGGIDKCMLEKIMPSKRFVEDEDED